MFGKKDRSPVDLRDFDRDLQGTAGYRIDGPEEFALAGTEIARVGDMNHDGGQDFAIDAPFSGATYVVFSKADMAPVSLSLFDRGLQLGQGFVINSYIPNRNHE